MNIKHISKTYGRKVSYNYQTWEFNGIADAELTEGENPETAAENLFQMVRDSVMNDMVKESQKSNQFRLAIDRLKTQIVNQLGTAPDYPPRSG